VVRPNAVRLTRNAALQPRIAARSFCDKAPKNKAQEFAEADAAGDAGNAVMLSPYQKVQAASRLGLYAGITGLVCTCGYFIAAELFPT
jgi:hypothetical protein